MLREPGEKRCPRRRRIDTCATSIRRLFDRRFPEEDYHYHVSRDYRSSHFIRLESLVSFSSLSDVSKYFLEAKSRISSHRFDISRIAFDFEWRSVARRSRGLAFERVSCLSRSLSTKKRFFLCASRASRQGSDIR